MFKKQVIFETFMRKSYLASLSCFYEKCIKII